MQLNLGRHTHETVWKSSSSLPRCPILVAQCETGNAIVSGTLRPLPQRREMEGSLGLSVAVVFVVLGDGVSVAKRVQGTNVSCKISKSWEILFSWVCLGSGCEIFLGGLRGWNAGKASQMIARRGFTSHCLLRGAFLIGSGPNKGCCKDRESINVQNEVYNKQRQFFHT